jgi:transglutaminase-like putative cysteine protease
MHLRLRYRATYRYAEPVSLCPHLLRIFPKVDQFLRVTELSFLPPPEADIQFRRDLYDNPIACAFFPKLITSFDLSLDAILETPERNPFHFLLESRSLRVPFDYDPLERAILAAYLQPEGGVNLPEPLLTDDPRPTVEALVTINQWLHQEIAYERREEGDPFLPAETLRRRRASCRDFSVLMLEVLRQNGIAARLVSGYLWEGDVETQDKVAQGALHAWVEAYIPGPGWVGLDPTNGVFCDHHAIPCAVGLTHAQIAPVAGFYYGNKSIASTLDTELSLEKIAGPTSDPPTTS